MFAVLSFNMLLLRDVYNQPVTQLVKKIEASKAPNIVTTYLVELALRNLLLEVSHYRLDLVASEVVNVGCRI